MNRGLVLAPIRPEDYIFGDQKLGDAPINPSGDWTGWLPDLTVQDKNGIEPYCCVSEALKNCIETLERHEFGATTEYSVRFLATVSDTASQKGNSIQAVAETLRKKGCCEEKDLPFDLTIDTFEKFYASIPQRLYTLALGFTAEYDFGHSYVNSTPADLMEALKYSPVPLTTYAWIHDPNGIFYRPPGVSDNHCVMLFNYKENEYWEVFDSYENRTDDGTYTGNSIKRIKWDCLPTQAKRITLHRLPVNQSAFAQFIYWLRKALSL